MHRPEYGGSCQAKFSPRSLSVSRRGGSKAAHRRSEEGTGELSEKSVKQIAVRFYPADADIWEWLQSRENRQGYIRDLIRADMENGRAFDYQSDQHCAKTTRRQRRRYSK